RPPASRPPRRARRARRSATAARSAAAAGASRRAAASGPEAPAPPPYGPRSSSPLPARGGGSSLRLMATTKVDPAELEARVLASVSELSKMPQPLDRAMTFADLNMDSLDVVEILQMVEDDFGI